MDTYSRANAPDESDALALRLEKLVDDRKRKRSAWFVPSQPARSLPRAQVEPSTAATPSCKGGVKAAEKPHAHPSEELFHPLSSVEHILAIPSSPPASREVVRTAIVPVTLSGADYRRAHDAHHIAAGLWNQAVDWVHGEWKAKHNPSKYDIRAFLTSIPREQRPLHAHTTEAIGYDLYEAIKTSRTNRKNGMRVRSPWRKKNYRPLSFSKHFGWRVRSDNKLNLSLGRGRLRVKVCSFTCHRDALVAINIPQEAIHGDYVP
ncbi:MAG: hypothetical protein M0008_09785 [Actinomycetota bacterium]|nr:hypothetical protein [Actinomycetota bacterium]